MAYINGIDEEDQRNKPGNLASVAPGVLTGTKANGNGAVDGKPTGSGFVNLQKYLGVNSDKANGLTESIANQGNPEIGQVHTSVGALNSLTPGAPIKKDLAGLTALESQLNTAEYADDVTPETQNFFNTNSAPKTYTGATADDVDKATAAAKAANEALTEKSKLFADSPDGIAQRANFLKGQYNKNGQYTSGENSFDNFLSGASDKANAGAFSDRAKEVKNILDVSNQNLDPARIDGLKSDIATNQADVSSYNEKFSRLKTLLGIKLANQRPEPPKPVAAPVPPPVAEKHNGVASTAGIPNAQGLSGLATNVVDTGTKAGADIAKEPGKVATNTLKSTGDGMRRGSDALNRGTQPVKNGLNYLGQQVDKYGNIIEDTGEKLNPLNWHM